MTHHADVITALNYVIEPGGERIGGTVIGADAKDIAATMRETGDAGAYHITLAHAGLRRETGDTWRKVAVTYLRLAGVDPTRLPWVAYHQREIENDHIHVVTATRQFCGRQIELRLSAARTDQIQVDLAARLQMHPPRLFNAAHGVSARIEALRKRGRLPEMRPLIDAINAALALWPRTFLEFGAALRAQPGGYTVEASRNAYGKISALFRGPDQISVRGGALARELEPRCLRSRFVMTRALWKLHDQLAERILTHSGRGAFHPVSPKDKGSKNGTSDNRRSITDLAEQLVERSEGACQNLARHERHRAQPEGAFGADRARCDAWSVQSGTWGARPATGRSTGLTGRGPGAEYRADSRGDKSPDSGLDAHCAGVGSSPAEPLGRRLIRINRIARRILRDPNLRLSDGGSIQVLIAGRPVALIGADGAEVERLVRHEAVDRFCSAILSSGPDPHDGLLEQDLVDNAARADDSLDQLGL